MCHVPLDSNQSRQAGNENNKKEPCHWRAIADSIRHRQRKSKKCEQATRRLGGSCAENESNRINSQRIREPPSNAVRIVVRAESSRLFRVEKMCEPVRLLIPGRINTRSTERKSQYRFIIMHILTPMEATTTSWSRVGGPSRLGAILLVLFLCLENAGRVEGRFVVAGCRKNEKNNLRHALSWINDNHGKIITRKYAGKTAVYRVRLRKIKDERKKYAISCNKGFLIGKCGRSWLGKHKATQWAEGSTSFATTIWCGRKCASVTS